MKEKKTNQMALAYKKYNKNYVLSFYASYSISKLVNMMMKGGKKSTAHKLIYLALVYMKESVRGCTNSIKYLEGALKSLEPSLYLVVKKVGRRGRNKYLIPTLCSTYRRTYYANKFFIEAVRARTKTEGTITPISIVNECKEIFSKDINCVSLRKKDQFISEVMKHKGSIRR